jgi:hypothetical protein
MSRVDHYRLDSIKLCDVGITWLNDVSGSLRRDVRPIGMDVTCSFISESAQN